jgi:hypothetical protein
MEPARSLPSEREQDPPRRSGMRQRVVQSLLSLPSSSYVRVEGDAGAAMRAPERQAGDASRGSLSRLSLPAPALSAAQEEAPPPPGSVAPGPNPRARRARVPSARACPAWEGAGMSGRPKRALARPGDPVCPALGCNRKAGLGTDHPGVGYCRRHSRYGRSRSHLNLVRWRVELPATCPTCGQPVTSPPDEGA